jgi:hypothetical protein
MITLSQEIFHQKRSFKFFSHIDLIVKKFLFQFQKVLERVRITWPWPIAFFLAKDLQTNLHNRTFNSMIPSTK